MTEQANDNVALIETAIRQAHGQQTTNIIMHTLLAISQEIPENANNLTPEMAEYLAGRFLKGMDLCGELYALAVSFEMKMELNKKKEFSSAMLIRSAEMNLKTAKEKEMYAHSDEVYLDAANKYTTAKMFRLMVEEKKDAFYKAHYLMRKVSDKDVGIDHMQETSMPDQDNVEDGWSRRSSAWAKK